MSHVIRQEIVIDAPIEVVWRTITEPDQIQLWFADRVELEARPGAAGTLEFDTADGAVVSTLTVEDVDAPNRLTYLWDNGDGPVLVEFTLVVEGPEQTTLRVRETGLDLLAWTEEQKAAYTEDHNRGWALHFGRIGQLLGPR